MAGILSGRVSPSGRLPVSVPTHSGGQPATYLAPQLAERSEVSNIDPTPAYGFGHGLSYSTIDWTDPTIDGTPVIESASPTELPTDGTARIGLTVRNSSTRDAVEVVQLYLHDPVASVVQPVSRLIGYSRVALAAGESANVVFEVPADVSSFTGPAGKRVVEPGALELRLARSSQNTEFTIPLRLTGQVRTVGVSRELHARPIVTR